MDEKMIAYAAAMDVDPRNVIQFDTSESFEDWSNATIFFGKPL